MGRPAEKDEDNPYKEMIGIIKSNWDGYKDPTTDELPMDKLIEMNEAINAFKKEMGIKRGIKI